MKPDCGSQAAVLCKMPLNHNQRPSLENPT